MALEVVTSADVADATRAGDERRFGSTIDGLVMLADLGLDVPPWFAVAGGADAAPAELRARLDRGLQELSAATARTFDAAADPLLVSVRTSSAGPLRHPVPAVLNLGPVPPPGAAAHRDLRAACAMIPAVTRALSAATAEQAGHFEAVVGRALDLGGVATLAALPSDLLGYVVQRFVETAAELGVDLPADPVDLVGAVVGQTAAALGSAGAGDDAWVVVQAQANGLGTDGGTGVGWSRDPHSGEPLPAVRFRADAQGNDVLGGTTPTQAMAELIEQMPGVATAVTAALGALEDRLGDMAAVEFTVDEGHLWFLRAGVDRSRSGPAALRVARDMALDPAHPLTRQQALLRIEARHLEEVLHPSFDGGERVALAVGLGASPGAAVGPVVFSAEAAIAAKDAGAPAILVKEETSPEDVHGMAAAVGILTTRGGLASHAAVVARGWGLPAVCGAEAVELGPGWFAVGDQRVSEGDVISIDGSSGAVVLGALEVRSVDPPPEFDEVLGWADEVRGERLGVRANADTGPDAATARRFGAEGIGLCRTEHMFLGEDRLPIVRQMILADTPAREKMAMNRLRMAQRDDFVEVLTAMDGLPVTVRLLDPPLHEFLPDLDELIAAEARGDLDDEGQRLLAAALQWRETNPMIGTRGVRLGYLKPGLYAMQVTALVEAVAERVAAGGDPRVEVMIPLTVSAPELAGARSWVTDVLDQTDLGGVEVLVGTMIETPRAAMQAGALAAHADFLSFGTNDLTQLTFGFSRDDVESRIMSLYLGQGLLEANPFEQLDRDGVGELVQVAAARGRAAKAELKLGVCGEHGGDPVSIEFLLGAGVDYVSCSPYRVPVARMAAAQALVRADVATE